MSRLLSNLIAMMFVFLLVACGGRETGIVNADPMIPMVVEIAGPGLDVGQHAYPAAQAGEFVLGGTTGAVTFEEGMNILQDTIVQDNILENDQLVRLVEGLGQSGATRGIGLATDAGLHIEKESGRATVFGEGPVVIIDMEEARVRPKENRYENVRISFLWPGDTYSFDGRHISFAARSGEGHVAPPEDECDVMAILGTLNRRGLAVRDCAMGGSASRTHQIFVRRDGETLTPGVGQAEDETGRKYPAISNARLDIMPLGIAAAN